MKKLFVTIITGVCMLGFTSCEQDQVIPNGNQSSGELKVEETYIGTLQGPLPESIIDQEASSENDSVNEPSERKVLQEKEGKTVSPILEPAINIAFDIEENIQRIEE